MPHDLEIYPVTLLRSIVGIKDLAEDATPEARALAHRKQAELLIDLMLYLLDHYTKRGYSAVTLSAMLITAMLRWTKEHQPK